MQERLIEFLAALGIDAAIGDVLLTVAIRSAEQTIINKTNQSAVPVGLRHIALHRAAGEYIRLLKSTGQLEGFELDTAAVSQIKEGDTTVTFAYGDGTETPDQRIERFVTFLFEYGYTQLNSYRRFKW